MEKWQAAAKGLVFDRLDTVIPGVERTPNPSRFSCVWNAETLPGSGASQVCR